MSPHDLDNSDLSSDEDSDFNHMTISSGRSVQSLDLDSEFGNTASTASFNVNFERDYDRYYNDFVTEVFDFEDDYLVFYRPKLLVGLKYKDLFLNKNTNSTIIMDIPNVLSAESSTSKLNRKYKDLETNKYQLFELLKLNSLYSETPYFSFSFYDYCFAIKFQSGTHKERIGDNLTTSKLGLFHNKKFYSSFHQSSIHSTYKNSIQVIKDTSSSAETFQFDEITSLSELEKSIFLLSRYREEDWLEKDFSQVNYLNYLFFKKNESLLKQPRLVFSDFRSVEDLCAKKTLLLKHLPFEHINFKHQGDHTDIRILFENYDYFKTEYIQKTVLSPDRSCLALLTNFGRVKIFLTKDLKESMDNNRALLQFSHLDDNTFFQKNKIKLLTYKQRFQNEVEVHMADMDWNIMNNGSVKDIEWADNKRLLYVTEMYTQRADEDFSTSDMFGNDTINFGFNIHLSSNKSHSIYKRHAIFKEPVIKILYLPKSGAYYDRKKVSSEFTEGHVYPYSLSLATFGLFKYPQEIVCIDVNIEERVLIMLILCENEKTDKLKYVLLSFKYSDSTESDTPVSLFPLNAIPLKRTTQITSFHLISRSQCLVRYDTRFEWISLETSQVIRTAIIGGSKSDIDGITEKTLLLPVKADKKQDFIQSLEVNTDFELSERASSTSMSRGLSVTPEPKEDSSKDRIDRLLNTSLNVPDPVNYYNILHLTENKVIIYDCLPTIYMMTFDGEKLVSQDELNIHLSYSKALKPWKINLLKHNPEKQELVMVFNERIIAKCSFNLEIDFSKVMRFEVMLKSDPFEAV